MELPDKLSDLIEQALEDMISCLDNPKIIFDMEEWHTPAHNGHCLMCLAGAYLHKRENTSLAEHLHAVSASVKYSTGDNEVYNIMGAIDAVRTGNLYSGIAYFLGGSFVEAAIAFPPGASWELANGNVTHFDHDDPDPFINSTKEKIKILRDFNL